MRGGFERRVREEVSRGGFERRFRFKANTCMTHCAIVVFIKSIEVIQVGKGSLNRKDILRPSQATQYCPGDLVEQEEEEVEGYFTTFSGDAVADRVGGGTLD